MKISELLDKNILIWGYGIEGKSVVELLLKNYVKNKIFVATKEKLDEKLESVEFIAESEIGKYNFDVAIKSPGVSSYGKQVQILSEKGTVITSSLNIMLAEIADYKNIKTIGITGTKGKSTTASICNHMLNSIGKKSILVGNVGIPFLNVIDNPNEYDYIVMELSSCQLNNLMYEINYGVILNLYPEHIDWHLTHDNYYKDKLNIVKYSKKCFLNAKDVITNKYIAIGNYSTFNSLNGFYLKDGHIFHVKDKIFDINSLDNIKGEHIFENICSVLSILNSEKLDINSALKSLASFKTLEHRLEIFFNDKKTNTKFVDDSISTIPEATIKAIETFRNDNVVLILGGFDRQQDYNKLIKYINNNDKIQKVFLLGQTGDRLHHELKNSEKFNTLDSLVKSIKNLDLTNTTVLLSPAAASFDMFKNFADRGDCFKKLMIDK